GATGLVAPADDPAGVRVDLGVGRLAGDADGEAAAGPGAVARARLGLAVQAGRDLVAHVVEARLRRGDAPLERAAAPRRELAERPGPDVGGVAAARAGGDAPD